jgi:hypothetical protein
VDMVEDARKWVKEYRRVKTLLREISELNREIIGAYVGTKRTRAANRAAAERPAPNKQT